MRAGEGLISFRTEISEGLGGLGLRKCELHIITRAVRNVVVQLHDMSTSKRSCKYHGSRRCGWRNSRPSSADSAHQVFVLSLKGSATSSTTPLDCISVDFDDVAALAQRLEHHNVETVISTLNLYTEAASQSQLNLIDAASRSKTTKRFIPSDFSFVTSGSDSESLLPFTSKSADALKKSGLQYTRVANGFFMDYWGMPQISTDILPYTWAVDVENKRAAIPGTGNDIISLTYSTDVADLVVRLLNIENWPEWSVISGSDITLNDLLTLAEKARGSKFVVIYDSAEVLEKNGATVLSGEYRGDGSASDEELKQYDSLFGRLTISGALRLPAGNRMNHVLNTHPLTAGELISKAWSGR